MWNSFFFFFFEERDLWLSSIKYHLYKTIHLQPKGVIGLQ